MLIQWCKNIVSLPSPDHPSLDKIDTTQSRIDKEYSKPSFSSLTPFVSLSLFLSFLFLLNLSCFENSVRQERRNQEKLQKNHIAMFQSQIIFHFFSRYTLSIYWSIVWMPYINMAMNSLLFIPWPLSHPTSSRIYCE